MNWWEWQSKHLFLVFVMGVGVLIWCHAPLYAEQAGPAEPYKDVRAETLQYVALGTPDDLLRLLEAFDKTEQEIARLELGAAKPEKQSGLNALKEQFAESEAILRLLNSSANEIPNPEIDRVSVESRASVQKKLLDRISDLRATIGALEKEIRFEWGENLRILVDERMALARLIAVRREELLGRYAAQPTCSNDDRRCLHEKLERLCKLKPLFSRDDDRGPVLELIKAVDSQLTVSNQSGSAMCDDSRHDSVK